MIPARLHSLEKRLKLKNMDAAILEKEALLLPDTERAILVDRLLASLSSTATTLHAAWSQEADARMTAFCNGEIQAVDGPQAMAELRSRFRK